MNSQSFCKFPCSAVLALGLLSAGAASAHLTTGNLEGSADIGDSVSVRNIATDHRLEHMVPKDGRFRFERLPCGIYEVVIHHPDGSAEPAILARARLGETVQVNPKQFHRSMEQAAGA